MALAAALTVQGAPFGGGDRRSAVERLSAFPMITTEAAAAAVVASLEEPGARLAGLAVTLPTISGESLRSLATVQEDFLKALEKVELPIAPAVGVGFMGGGRELPWPTLVAFAGGGVMLVALAIFGTALFKMSMEDSRKARRMRRRYAP